MENLQKAVENNNPADLDHQETTEDSPQPTSLTPVGQESQNNETEEQYQASLGVDPNTESMYEITKSQILLSQILTDDNGEASSEQLITSESHEMIDSNYQGEEDQDKDSKAEAELEERQELFEDVKMGYDLRDRITELSDSLITSMELRSEDKEADVQLIEPSVKENKTNEEERPVEEMNEHNPVEKVAQLTESCVDLGTEIGDAKQEEVDHAEDKNGQSTVIENAKLTDSRVDLMGDHDEEENFNDSKEEQEEQEEQEEEEEEENSKESQKLADEYQPNASMEIIDKKQCENDEDYEKVEAEAVASVESPKRNIENEIWELPLGGESLKKKITQYGEEIMGRDYRPNRSQMCTISYTASLKDTSEVVEQNDELSFILGDGDVISAIDLVVSLMSKNEKCDVITEARHAYGSLGKKPVIPADATLCYKIHLKDFKDVTELELMEPVERLSLAEAKKVRGNFHFNRQDFSLAGISYRKGLKYFDLQNLRSSEEKEDLEKFAELRKALLMNLALSDFKQNEYKKALVSLNEVLDIEATHMKALYIRGKVLIHLGETQEAVQSLTKAHELAKDNVEVKNELAKAQAKHKLQYEKEKRMYQKMMRGTSDEKETNKPKTANSSSGGFSSFATYTAAGLLMAGATLGVAMLAKYKNLL